MIELLPDVWFATHAQAPSAEAEQVATDLQSMMAVPLEFVLPLATTVRIGSTWADCREAVDQRNLVGIVGQ